MDYGLSPFRQDYSIPFSYFESALFDVPTTRIGSHQTGCAEFFEKSRSWLKDWLNPEEEFFLLGLVRFLENSRVLFQYDIFLETIPRFLSWLLWRTMEGVPESSMDSTESCLPQNFSVIIFNDVEIKVRLVHFSSKSIARLKGSKSSIRDGTRRVCSVDKTNFTSELQGDPSFPMVEGLCLFSYLLENSCDSH